MHISGSNRKILNSRKGSWNHRVWCYWSLSRIEHHQRTATPSKVSWCRSHDVVDLLKALPYSLHCYQNFPIHVTTRSSGLVNTQGRRCLAREWIETRFAHPCCTPQGRQSPFRELCLLPSIPQGMSLDKQRFCPEVPSGSEYACRLLTTLADIMERSILNKLSYSGAL